MPSKNALILAGTGMLDRVVQTLVVEGWQVVLPSRRYNPIAFKAVDEGPGAVARRALRPKGHLPTVVGRDAPGHAIWVEAQWERPRELARAAAQAMSAPADLLVSWVHESFRRSVTGAVESLLADGAPVVEVRGASAASSGDAVEPILAGHPTQQVLLGTVSERDSARALAQAEIADGVLTAVRRALEGRPSSLHQVGQRRPAGPR